MSANQEHLLIDHLDKTLLANQMLEVEELIRNDRAVAHQWECMKLAVQAVEYASLREQVASVSEIWYAEQNSLTTSNARPAVVRTMYRNIMRVAACIILLIGSTSIYKYLTVSADGLYNQNYSSYELNTSRGITPVNSLEQAYRDKNWVKVLNLSAADKNNKSLFLAGMASMELKKYDLAIADFDQVIAANRRTGDNYFGDEADYYLAMSLIANHQISKALVILDRIKADKNHLYNKKASDISGMDIKIALLKDGK
jgi:hypothetical protein